MGNVPSGCDGYSTWAVLLNILPDIGVTCSCIYAVCVQAHSCMHASCVHTSARWWDLNLLICILYVQAMYIGVHVHQSNCAYTLCKYIYIYIYIYLHLYIYLIYNRYVYYSSTIRVLNTCMQEWPAGLTGHPHLLLEVQLHSLPDWEPPQSSRLLGATYKSQRNVATMNNDT